MFEKNRSYCRLKFCIAGIEILDLCCCCDLDLDPMTFIYELDPYPWRYTACENMNFLRQGYRKLSSETQTDIHTHIQTDRHDRKYVPHRFAGGQLLGQLASPSIIDSANNGKLANVSIVAAGYHQQQQRHMATPTASCDP